MRRPSSSQPVDLKSEKCKTLHPDDALKKLLVFLTSFSSNIKNNNNNNNK